MGLLKEIQLKNFMCFREETALSFSKATYLIGSNNSGKTAILLAFRCFFDEELFKDEAFLNRTEFVGKGSAHNKSVISITFDLEAIQTKTLKQRLIKKYGNLLTVTKCFTYKRVANKITVDYEIGGNKCSTDNIPDDIKKVLSAIHLTYLHPQEGKELLGRAQAKLKDRLLLNWGRKGEMTQSLQKFKISWDSLRKNANIYLSKALTRSLQDIWIGSVIKINLPKDIDDIIGISDISFQGSKNIPEIELTLQGTGAQSLVLYFTHYLLDSDRSLHAGEYHPVWLLEEPESFLHADLMFKLGRELNSPEWLANIQIIISTHSPIILATSRLAQEHAIWNLLKDNKLDQSKTSNKWTPDEIKQIGNYMGDSNFYIYFLAFLEHDPIFIEDIKPITTTVWREGGVNVTKGLGGVDEIKKHIETLQQINHVLPRNIFFIVDGPRADKEFKRFMHEDSKVGSGEFIKYKIEEKIYLIVLPKSSNTEDLFDEFDNFVEEQLNVLCEAENGNYKLKEKIPNNLLETCRVLKKKLNDSLTKSTIKSIIKVTDNIKSLFWKKVEEENLKFSIKHMNSLQVLLK